MAQDNFGVHVDTPERATILVQDGETIEGNVSGVYADNGPVDLTVEDGGTVRGNGTNPGSASERPDGGVVIAQPDSTVSNAGLIIGAAHGVVTSNFFSEDANGDALPPEKLATGTSVTNLASGSIIGQGGYGVGLYLGGTVDNSGYISGSGRANSAGVFVVGQGEIGLDSSGAGVGSITNSGGGVIEGTTYGVLLSGGGTIDNAGTISASKTPAGVSPAGVLVNAFADETGRIATINNSGTISGFFGVLAAGNLESTELNNSGSIEGVAVGVINNLTGGGTLTINNGEAGVIRASGAALNSINGGLVVNNEEGAAIVSTGSSAIVIAHPGSALITNAGTIDGQYFGILTQGSTDPATGQAVPITAGIEVNNSGLVIGRNDDGMRLQGGGSVTNSGTVRGEVGDFADGISMFPDPTQSNDDYSALVTNLEGGKIFGNRFGIILSGGGTVDNAGDVTGNAGGVYIQGIATNSDSSEDRAGVVALVTNSGRIEGLGPRSNQGYGVGFGSDLGAATLINSGSIKSAEAEGVSQGSTADLLIQNLEGGSIEGGTSGVFGDTSGTMTIENAGSIRGNGTYDGFDAAPDAGITIATANSSVTNSGTISGAGAGITTAYAYDSEQDTIFGQAIGTVVINSGTISGESNDGVRLIGGGSVINSGMISGVGNQFADGISMFRYNDQANESYAASVDNEAEGSIVGDRFAIILSGGGSVENAGSLSGGLGGVQLQSQGDAAGQVASLTNSGDIMGETNAGVTFAGDLDSASLDNSGSIGGATAGLLVEIRGDTSVVNSGTIDGGGGLAIAAMTTGGAIALTNSGSLLGGAVLSALDDTVVLQTGSRVTGTIDAGDGDDSLTLEGDVLELTDTQILGAADNFESLTVASGYWNTSGPVGSFNTVAINEGAALQVNEIELEGEPASPVLTSDVLLDGTLVLNFSSDDTVSELDALSITGTGSLQLIGEAVFTVDTDALAYTGGTTISNGGLVLTGALPGNVTTEGDGFFTLGAGGTEGSFAGDLVNNGTFNFNRSDDYDFLGAFSGSGTLNKYGEGSLVFMGDYAFEGLTNIFAGTVRIGGIIDPTTDFNLGDGGGLDITGKDQTIGGLSGQEGAQVVLGEQILTIDQDENTEFAGTIEGMGGIIKDGDGVLNLSGDSSYTGDTEINGGKLAVNGSIVSDVFVNAGGTLGGNGSTGAVSVGDGGMLAPGNSIGRLTVNGDLTFAAGSIYEVEVNAAGQGDRVDATGAVTIASTASVAVMAADGNYAPRTDYTIITGAQGVTGSFGSVTSDLAFLDPLLRYDANTVRLSLYRNDIDFADVAVSSNQAAVAGAVQALGIDNPLFETVLVQNATNAQAIYTDLSGEILASTVTGLTDDSRHLRNALMAMPTPGDGGVFVWGSGFGGWGEFDRGLGLKTDHKGFVAGIGMGGAGFGVALSGGLGSSDFHQSGRRDSANVDTKYLAAHGKFGLLGLQGSAGISYAWHDIASVRSVGFAGLAQTLESSSNANTLQIFGELGYRAGLGGVAVTPYARLAHVSTDVDAFVEKGGSGALTVRDSQQDTTFLSLGARFELNVPATGFQPYASLAWNRALGDRYAVATSRFAGGAADFNVVGTVIPKDSAELEAGFDYRIGSFSIGAAYSGTLAGSRDTHGARITARLDF